MLTKRTLCSLRCTQTSKYKATFTEQEPEGRPLVVVVTGSGGSEFVKGRDYDIDILIAVPQ